MISKKRLPIYITIFLFPILIATVRNGGGVLFTLLLFYSLVNGWSAFRTLDTWEKRIFIGFGIFFILVSLSLINTQDFSSGMKKIERYIHFPLFLPMYLLLKKYRVETGKVFLLGVLISSLLMFGQAFYQSIILDGYRATGAYNPIILGDIAMLVAVIVVSALLTVARKWQHYMLGGGAIGLALIASVMSGSKGAWILVPVIMIWFLWIKRENIRTSQFVSIVVLGSLLIFGVINLNQVSSRIHLAVLEWESYSQGTLDRSMRSNSLRIRLEMWRDSLKIWETHPLIGTGIGDFKYDRDKFINEGRSHQGIELVHAHSIYFDALATTGLLGFIALLLFIQILPFRMFYFFWKREHDPWIKFYALSGMATIIAFVVFGLTEAWLSRNMFVRTYLMCILVFMSSIAVRKASLENKS